MLLQRTVGNQAVQRLFKSGVIQAKLKIGEPGDSCEQEEADRLAEQIVQRKAAPCTCGGTVPVVGRRNALIWREGGAGRSR
jgi:hypothetical protein